MITRQQRAVLNFIHARLRDTGIPPSFQEMADAIGVKSKSGVSRLIKALEDRGYLRRIKRRARCIEVLRLSEPDPQPAPSITLKPEILTLTDRYAAEHKISRDTAANELLRIALGAAA